MSRLGPSATSDRGAAVIMVTMLVSSGLIMGLMALVVDLGRLRVERLELRRAANAAVFSAAYDCSFSPTTTTTQNCGKLTYATAPTNVSPAGMADRNSGDGLGTAVAICGKDKNNKLTACPSPVPTARDCARLPSALNFVQVTVQTRTASGSRIEPLFARIIPGYSGSTLTACSQALWGAPTALPVTVGLAISKTCWNFSTANGTTYAPAPPYTSTTARDLIARTYEKALVMPGGSRDGSDSCQKATSGPGGFGFVDVASCVMSPTLGTLPQDVGADGRRCKDLLLANVFRIINVPIYDQISSGSEFNVVGFAPFFLSGWELPAVPRQAALNSSVRCPAGNQCLFGWFTQSTVLTYETAGVDQSSSSNFGLNVVKLAG